MVKNNFSMVENNENIPFTRGYSLLSSNTNAEWLLKFRRQGFESYLKKYNSVDENIRNFISHGVFELPKFDVLPSLDMLLKYPMLDIEAYTIILINGKYCPEFSTEEELPFSVFSDGVSYSLSDDEKFLEDKLKCDDNVFVSLNSAYLSNGVVIDIESGAKISKPIHIISVVCEDRENIFVNPRVFINIGSGVSVDIIESNFSFDEKYFENKVCQFNVGKNSNVNHYKYFSVSENSCVVGNNYFNIDDNAKFNQIVFAKKCGLLKNFYQFDVEENSILKSVASVDANLKQQPDITAFIKHNKDNAFSDVSLFATVNDEANVNFTTSVQCANGIIGVETNQISRIILNSSKARGQIKPQQNIFSEKVKAYHGAVISGINKKDLFFLESRGIDENNAKILILKSCLANILQNIHNEEIYNAFYNLIWL